MNDLISVCIPTYQRPELLEVALRSVFAQDYRPLEVVVSDDSSDDRSEVLVAGLEPVDGIRVVYARNRPGLGQNRNVDGLFGRAGGDRLVLLHDDDALLPGGIAALAACWARSPDLVIAFGRQEIIAHDGTPLPAETTAVNARYARPSGQAGPVASAMEAALRQQIPNNGYLVRSDVARAVGYRSVDEVGTACDLDFTLRLGWAYDRGAAYFVDRLVSQYRYNEAAISSSGELQRREQPRSGLLMYRFVEALELRPELAGARRVLLRRLSSKAVKSLALDGARAAALRIYLSPNYPWSARLSKLGLYHAALIAAPRVDRLRRYGAARRARSERSAYRLGQR